MADNETENVEVKQEPGEASDPFLEEWERCKVEQEEDGNHHEPGDSSVTNDTTTSTTPTNQGIGTNDIKQEDGNSYQGYEKTTDDGSKKEVEGKSDFVIRVRGLPWSTKEKDVQEFFSACENIIAIHFTYSREGRPTGEAYIELGSSEDVDRALVKNRELLGQRYIEVFVSKKDEMEFVLKRNGRRTGVGGSGRSGSVDSGGDGGATPDPETVVRLRGLPFGCTKEDIITFFEGLEIAADGIVFAAQHQSPHYGPQSGRRSKPGEAYVRFINKETTERALDRHMNKIGHRWGV